MNIIPQQSQFTQVGIQNRTELVGFSIDGNNDIYTTLTSASASQELYRIGLNVFPLPYGRKSGYPWRRLQYTRLHRQHSIFGIFPLFAGHCNVGVMCGITSANLFVIDCEHPDTFFAHLHQLEQRHIPRWAVVTARGGHIYLRCREGEVDNIAPGILPNAEIRGKNSYVLAPPSIHPSGVEYRWLFQEGKEPPAVSVEEINWLRDEHGKRLQLTATPNARSYKITWKRGTVSPYSNLSKTTKDYLKNGHLIPEGTRNNRLFSAACDMLGNDYSISEIENLLMPLAIGSGLTQREIIATLHSAAAQTRSPARPQQFQHKTDNMPHKALWRHALFFASHHEWVGRTSGNQKALFLALIEKARVGINEHGVFRASLRELADLARMTVNTVRRNLATLQKYTPPLLFKVGEDRMSGASLWRFSDAVLQEGKRQENLLDAAVPEHWLRYAESLFHSDGAERGAMGKSGMFLYRFMTDKPTPMMPSALAAASRLSINQVNYALSKLKKLGLVQRIKTGWVITGNFTDEELGRISHAEGWGEKRRRRHQREREIFVGRLLAAARMRSEGTAYINALIEQRQQQNRLYQPRRDTAAAAEEDASQTNANNIDENKDDIEFKPYHFTPDTAPPELAGLPPELLADDLVCFAILDLGGEIVLTE